ncbi:hypothetical protein [Spiroplasma endosymbiont of Asaphidion curtum]
MRFFAILFTCTYKYNSALVKKSQNYILAGIFGIFSGFIDGI